LPFERLDVHEGAIATAVRRDEAEAFCVAPVGDAADITHQGNV
jgi:hypothetical protein